MAFTLKNLERDLEHVGFKFEFCAGCLLGRLRWFHAGGAVSQRYAGGHKAVATCLGGRLR